MTNNNSNQIKASQEFSIGGNFEVSGQNNYVDASLKQYFQEIHEEYKLFTPESVISNFKSDNLKSPYKALESFDVYDADLFQGRTLLIRELLQACELSNLILVLGASGSGKSSVVRAGLIPKFLKQKNETRHYFLMTPGQNPFKSLKNSLVGRRKELSLDKLDFGDSEDRVEFVLKEKNNTFKRIQQELITSGVKWLIFIDQFEQLFTDCQNPSWRKNFIDSINEIAQSKNSSLTIVLAMRADFLEQFTTYPQFGRIAQKNIHLVAEMYPEELEMAIKLPAAQRGVVFERGLVPLIVSQLQGKIGTLPLLQYTLHLLWEYECEPDRNGIPRIYDRTLNTSSYNELRGIHGALQKHIEEVYTNLNDLAQQDVTKQIFLKLIQWISGERGQYIPVSRRKFDSDFKTDIEKKVLKIFIDERLIVKSTKNLNKEALQSNLTDEQQPTVEIAHEILITTWERFRGWLEEAKDVQIAKSQLEMDMARYLDALTKNEANANDELLIGSKLERIIELQDQGMFELRKVKLDDSEIEFIEKSVEWRDRQRHQQEKLLKAQLAVERQKKRQLNQIISIGIVSIIVITIAASIAIWQWRESVDREATSRSLQLAAVATNSLHTDTTRSLLLAIQANVIRETPQSRTALWNAFKANHERYYLKYTDPLVYGEFDPHNSKRLLTGSDKGEAVLWDLDQLDKPKVFKAHTGSIKRASFDPYSANRFLTVSSNDKEAHIWDTANSGAPIATLKGHNRGINYSCFDPQNPNRVLTASSDGTAIIWDVNTKKPLYNLKGHEGDVWMASFAPNNSKRVLTVSRDGTARVWNLDDLKNPIILRGHRGSVLYGSFDPKNSNRLLTTGDDGIARIWNLQDGSKIELEGHTGSVPMGVFSLTDAKQVLTVGEDSTVRLWNIDKPKTASKILRKHEGKVTFGDFDPQNKNRILTVGVDGKGYIWDATTGNVVYELNGHSEQINFALFDPKKLSRIVTVSNDKTARIWSLAKPEIFEISQNEGVAYATFSNQNKGEILTIDRDGKIKAWNFKTLKDRVITRLNTGINSIKSASLSPNNSNQIAIINMNGQVEIWDIDKPNQAVFKLPKQKENAKIIKFSTKNSNYLLVLNDNGVITIHNLQKPQLEPTVLSVYPNLISSGEFDPDNTDSVLTTTNKGEFVIWDIKNPSDPIEITRKFVEDIILWYGAFDPLDTNRILITGSNDFAKFYNLKNIEKENIPLEQKGTVTHASFASPNRNQLLTITQSEVDRLSSINLWDQKLFGEPLMTIEDNSYIDYAQFSLNTDNLLTISSSGTIKVYEINTKNIAKLSWQNASRCLSKNEINLTSILDLYRNDTFLDYINTSEPSLTNKKHYSYCEEK